MTFLIDSIITAVVAILIAAIDLVPFLAGPEGIIIGVIASALILVLGKDKMQETILTSNIPKPIRKMVPKNMFESRIDSVTAEIKQAFYDSLNKEKSEEITARMVDEISGQIENTLLKMAEVVEIPLG